MALTSPNMGLKEWDLPGDVYSHTDLVTNWNAIDTHDHTSGKGVQIPTAGIGNLAVTGPKIAANSIDGTKIIDGSLTDSELFSPNNGVYRNIYQGAASIVGGTVVGTYFFSSAASASGSTAGVSGSPGAYPDLVPLTAADYAVVGRTTRIRVLYTWAVNAVAPTASFTAGLYPISLLAGSGAMTTTLGAVVTGTTVLASNPPGAAANFGASGDINLPANAIYVPGFTITGGTTAASSIITFNYFLQIRHA